MGEAPSHTQTTGATVREFIDTSASTGFTVASKRAGFHLGVRDEQRAFLVSVGASGVFTFVTIVRTVLEHVCVCTKSDTVGVDMHMVGLQFANAHKEEEATTILFSSEHNGRTSGR